VSKTLLRSDEELQRAKELAGSLLKKDQHSFSQCAEKLGEILEKLPRRSDIMLARLYLDRMRALYQEGVPERELPDFISGRR
jgi:hypothetical protein